MELGDRVRSTKRHSRGGGSSLSRVTQALFSDKVTEHLAVFCCVKSTNEKISSAVKVPGVQTMHHLPASLVYQESKMELRVAYIAADPRAH